MFKFEFICMYLIIIVSLVNNMMSCDDYTSYTFCCFTTVFPAAVLVLYFITGLYKRNLKG